MHTPLLAQYRAAVEELDAARADGTITPELKLDASARIERAWDAMSADERAASGRVVISGAVTKPLDIRDLADAALPARMIAVRDHLRSMKSIQDAGLFDAATKAAMKSLYVALVAQLTDEEKDLANGKKAP